MSNLKANYCYAVTELLDKELLFSCECVGKCNNVSHEKIIDVLHDMICNVVKECNKICYIKQKSADTNFCRNKKLSELKQKALNAHKLWVQCK